MRFSFAIFIACVVSLHLPASSAWICNVTLVGNTSAPQPLQFSDASVSCSASRAAERNRSLSVGADISLYSASFAGKIDSY